MTPDSSALSLRSLVDAHPSLRPSPTPPKEIIAVCGGVRGLQGSSVVKFLLRDNIFQARALTRDVESPKAIELVKLGVQVVYADFDKPETLKTAFEGVYGVFGMTNFFEHADGPREIRQGKNLVDAAREAGVKHFVWSTCEECPTVISIGTKAVVQDYLEKSGVPYTNVFFVFYYESNLLRPYARALAVHINGLESAILEQSRPLIAREQAALDQPATCDACNHKITGVRWRCQDCPDWDSCSTCYNTSVPTVHPGHRFVKIESRQHIPAPKRTFRHRARCDACNKEIWDVRFKVSYCSVSDFRWQYDAGKTKSNSV